MAILPDVWGNGSYFAYSGLEGQNSYDDSLLGTLLQDKLGILVHAVYQRELFFELSREVEEIKYKCISNDLLLINLLHKGNWYEAGITFYDSKTLIGKGYSFARPVVAAELGVKRRCADNIIELKDSMCSTCFAENEINGTIFFALTLGFIDECREKLRRILESEQYYNHAINRKLSFFKKLPEISASDFEKKTYSKCFSVLKSNVMSPEGTIKHRWATPDRLPHKTIFLWDTIFQAIGYKYLDIDFAYESILALFDNQYDSGFIPHMVAPYYHSEITQPPLIAWGLLHLHDYHKNFDALDYAYPRIIKFFDWILENRDSNKNLLFEWYIDSEPTCRCGESGADNSPRFDTENKLDAVDFSSFMASEAKCIARMSSILGYIGDTLMYTDIYEEIKESINKYLWDKEESIYYDRSVNGGFHKIKTPASFFPLFAGVADEEKAAGLIKHLENPHEFYTPMPVPSVAINEPFFSKDMWRGNVWLCYNYLITSGLLIYGYKELALNIMRKSIDEICRWYRYAGCVFEFYDSLCVTPPYALDRKGPIVNEPYDLKRRCKVIRDYGWTCSVYIEYLLLCNRIMGADNELI